MTLYYSIYFLGANFHAVPIKPISDWNWTRLGTKFAPFFSCLRPLFIDAMFIDEVCERIFTLTIFFVFKFILNVIKYDSKR